ncbi:SOS response-associated peptidase [Salinibacterium sp. G-O1]|uniref:SOS response-associated peptidase n=1 Tax=Salinibacterium sp. G-O1 TaxID=3046208 RepID=UPI0024BAA109|nr:SOS response-associated peptidase [Salinibacterium sp. G-O1]MDJ0335453.1 SOS response-associated peptidase [Salinibacterium sp. G-O1]
MCGRFVVAGATADLVEMFDIDLVAPGLPEPSFNIAPTDRVSIVIDTIGKGAAPDDEPVRRIEAARWGLVPVWSKDPKSGASAINARIETAAEKSTFATAVKKRRAVIPATGYYEWKTIDGVKTPHFIHLPEGELMVFAGLYEWWRDPAAADDSPDKWMLSTSILTRDATGELAGIHDRMPVFLSPGLLDEWLDPHTEGSEELLDEISAGGAEVAEFAEFHEVDRAVGNVRSSGPSLIEPVNAA